MPSSAALERQLVHSPAVMKSIPSRACLLQIIHELSGENEELKEELEQAHAAQDSSAEISRCCCPVASLMLCCCSKADVAKVLPPVYVRSVILNSKLLYLRNNVASGMHASASSVYAALRLADAAKYQRCV